MVKIEREWPRSRGTGGAITDAAGSSAVLGFYQSPETGKNRRPIFPGT